MNHLEATRRLTLLGILVRDSHFVLASGRHSRDYLDKDRLFIHPLVTSALCEAIAEQFKHYAVQAVVGPEKGGIIVSQWVAFHLARITGHGVSAFYAEKTEDGGFVLKRGGAQTEIPGKNILVVDDVLTTGGSAKKVIEAVRALGGHVVGLGALCNRGGVVPDDVANPPEFWSLVNIRIDSWDEAGCPLCKQNIPINTAVGKGAEYLASKQAS